MHHKPVNFIYILNDLQQNTNGIWSSKIASQSVFPCPLIWYDQGSLQAGSTNLDLKDLTSSRTKKISFAMLFSDIMTRVIHAYLNSVKGIC